MSNYSGEKEDNIGDPANKTNLALTLSGSGAWCHAEDF